MRLAARLLLDLGGVEQGGHYGRGADADGNARFHQLRPPLFVRSVGFIAHARFSMASGAAWEEA